MPNIEDKSKLREEIKKKIKESSSTKKIYIDKDELEYLLFDTVNTKCTIRKKYLVWSGPFLSKIDLSEIDFNDVEWNINDEYYVKNSIKSIDLIRTNANIDFSKSFDYKEHNSLNISFCNFKGTNLSKSFKSIEFDKLKEISNSCFKNTKLNININNFKNTRIYNNDFSECKFENCTIDESVLTKYPNNNYSNSNIRIKAQELTENLYKNIYECGYLDNCYINDKKIDSSVIIDDKAREYTNKRTKNEYIKEYRKTLQERLSKRNIIPKIHIDKNLLEDLLFETRYVKKTGEKENIIKVKYLVWSGPFLSKIDLSEVDFNDVEWNVKCHPFICNGVKEYSVYELFNVKTIDLSNTNAKIDLLKSAKQSDYFGLELINCNFAKTDLSNNIIQHAYIVNCDLSNTNIDIDLNKCVVQKTNLSNNDFSKYTVTDAYLEDELSKSNFKNTGLNIKLCYYSNIEDLIEDSGIQIDGLKINDKFIIGNKPVKYYKTEDELLEVLKKLKKKDNMSLEEQELLKNEILELLTLLPERESKIIRLRFGLDNEKPKTLEDVGKVLGLTKERIRQLESKALSNLIILPRSR